MHPYGWLRALARGVLLLFLLAPVVAILLATLVDRGPSGHARWSLLPIALVALDPFVWTCFRNSLIFAVVNSVAALILGVGLGWVGARRALWARASHGAAAALSSAAPAFLALGLIGLWGPPYGWPWPLIRSGPAVTGASLESWRGFPLWVAWIWTTLPGGVALVALATVMAVERLHASWSDAARLAGARPFRAWRNVSWPIIRPAAARAAALVFLMALLEPGAPLILGLRRTIAFQIVDSARRSDPFPRLAICTGLAGLVALAGWSLFSRWRGPVIVAGGPINRFGAEKLPATRNGSLLTGILLALLVVSLMMVACLPILGLFRLATEAAWVEGPSNGRLLQCVSSIGARLREPPVPELALNSMILGLEVSLVLTVLAWLLGTTSVRTNMIHIRHGLALAPPLAQGVGVLSISWLAGLAATSLVDAGRLGRLSASLEHFSRIGSIDHTPWIPLTFSVGLSLVVVVLESAGSAGAVRESRSTAAFDAARLVGTSRSRARSLSIPSQRRRRVGFFFLICALAATSLSPTLLFTPWSDGRTVGPGVLDLANGPGDAQSQAAALALCVVAVNFVALTVARLTSALPSADC